MDHKTTGTRNNRFKGTIFVDLDGVLVEHQPQADIDHMKLLDGTSEKIAEWIDQGYYIVLTTARERSVINSHFLRKHGIDHHDLITALPPGPRYLINDRKPLDRLTPMAIGINLDRDQGVGKVNLHYQADKKGALMSKGVSGAKVELIKDNDNCFVRKSAPKHADSNDADKVIRQAGRLQKLWQIRPLCVPQIFDFTIGSDRNYYDMEYLGPPWQQSSECYAANNDEYPVMITAINDLMLSIYENTLVKCDAALSFHSAYVSEVYAKLIENSMEIENLNKAKIEECLSLIDEMDQARFAPSYLCFIHGDLTFENIMYHPDEETVVLLDPDDAGDIDDPMKDLGKLLQSALAGYEAWKNMEDPYRIEDLVVSDMNDEARPIIDFWNTMFPGRHNLSKGYMHLGFHLIRMIRYRAKISPASARFALDLAIKYLKLSLQ